RDGVGVKQRQCKQRACFARFRCVQCTIEASTPCVGSFARRTFNTAPTEIPPTLTRPHCADRRDGLRTFGDIVYTLNISQRMAQVDLRDALSTEEDLPESVLIGWPQGDGMSREGLWQLDVAPLEGDPSLLLDFAYQVVGGVGDRRQMLGHGARARLIAAGRGCH